jgi:hypothetical protein
VDNAEREALRITPQKSAEKFHRENTGSPHGGPVGFLSRGVHADFRVERSESARFDRAWKRRKIRTDSMHRKQRTGTTPLTQGERLSGAVNAW